MVVLVRACPNLSLTTLKSMPICAIRLACVALVVDADAGHARLGHPAVVVAGEVVAVDWGADAGGKDQSVVLPGRSQQEALLRRALCSRRAARRCGETPWMLRRLLRLLGGPIRAAARL